MSCDRRRPELFAALATNRNVRLTAGNDAPAVYKAVWAEGWQRGSTDPERDRDDAGRFLARAYSEQGLILAHSRPDPEYGVPIPRSRRAVAAWAHTARVHAQMAGDMPWDPQDRTDVARHVYGDAAVNVPVNPPPAVEETFTALHKVGARPYLVGGCVRDAAAGTADVKDWDIEVYDSDPDTVARALRTVGTVDEVGKSFGVLAVRTKDGTPLDVSFPRRDNKTGDGHRGFTVDVDPNMTLEEGSSRRDFTINTLMYDPRLRTGVDYHGGLADLNSGTLRHVGPAFREDPLRVIRGAQFSARFNLHAHPDTVKECQDLAGTWEQLPSERIGGEWSKLTGKAPRPGTGLAFMEQTGWDAHAPGLQRVNNPDLWRDVDRTAALCDRDRKPAAARQNLVVAVVASRINDREGADTTAAFLNRLKTPTADKTHILNIVKADPPTRNPDAPQVRALARKLHPATVEQWATVHDGMGSDTTAWRDTAAREGVLHRREEPLLGGKHVLAERGAPRDGRKIGALLAAAAHDQEQGKFRDMDGALAWLRAQPADPDWRS